MIIQHAQEPGFFTCMKNHHLRDKRLSLKAKGLLSLMFSLPEEWRCTLSGLTRLSADGRDAVSSAMNELIQAGYVCRKRVRDASGQVGSSEVTLVECPGEECREEKGPGKRKKAADSHEGAEQKGKMPEAENPVPETPVPDYPVSVYPVPVYPVPENPDQENPPLLNTDLSNTDRSNTDPLNTNPSNTDESNTDSSSTNESSPHVPAEIVSVSPSFGKKPMDPSPFPSLPVPSRRTHSGMPDSHGTSTPVTSPLSAEDLIRQVKKQVSFDDLTLGKDEFDIRRLEEIVSIIADVLASGGKGVVSDGVERPPEMVMKNYRALTGEHVNYAFHDLKKSRPNVRDTRRYLRTVLYNASISMYNRDRTSMESIEDLVSFRKCWEGIMRERGQTPPETWIQS